MESISKTIAYIVRHGETQANADNKFRSWTNPPLNKNGVVHANDAASNLDGKSIARIAGSDLKRSADTANIIGASIGIDPETNSDLRPWNLGDLSGADRSPENMKTLLALIENPDSLPPGDGESLNSFQSRNAVTLTHYLREAATKKEVLLLVLHTSNIVSLISGYKPEDDEIAKPGDILTIEKTDAGYLMKIL